MSVPRVCLSIINYKGRQFLSELLESIRIQTYRDCETILIDNDSQDGSVDFVRSEYPWVRTLPQSSNLGYARAANLAMRSSEAEYVAILNTDLKLGKDWVEQIVRPAESDSSVAVVASKLLLYDYPQYLNGVGGGMTHLGYTWDRGMFERDEGQYDQVDDVAFACGGAALFRRRTILKVGGFDEMFYMYHEDVDLCWRLWVLGYRVVTAPRAVAYHKFSASTGDNKGMMWRELMGERNNIRSLLKNRELRRLIPLLRELYELPQEPARKELQWGNFLWNLRRLPNTLWHRLRIQWRRRNSDAELERLLLHSEHVPVDPNRFKEIAGVREKDFNRRRQER